MSDEVQAIIDLLNEEILALVIRSKEAKRLAAINTSKHSGILAGKASAYAHAAELIRDIIKNVEKG